MASYADARSGPGQWFLRIEDLDRPRERPGAADLILRTLALHGIEWDGPVLYQSGRTPTYRRALDLLIERGHCYPCGCNRSKHPYPGTCRKGLPPGATARSWRFRTAPGRTGFVDRLQGFFDQDVENETGDFVLFRADGVFAYQLAVVVDDAEQGITDVVRGADLLDSTPRQILLYRALGLEPPRYLHVPVALDEQGEKLSKQTGAPPLDQATPLRALLAAWKFLGQPPPESASSVAEFWKAAIRHWDPARIPAQTGLPVTL